MRTLLVCGDRNWDDEKRMRNIIEGLVGTIDTLIHGDCRGADKMAAKIGEEMGLEIRAFPANWAKYGKAAGPIRNQQMLDEGAPSLVIAFHKDIEKSKGTRDMMRRAREAGLLTHLVA